MVDVNMAIIVGGIVVLVLTVLFALARARADAREQEARAGGAELALERRFTAEWKRTAEQLRAQLETEVALARARTAGAADDFEAARRVGVALADGDRAARLAALVQLLPGAPAPAAGAQPPAAPGEPLASA